MQLKEPDVYEEINKLEMIIEKQQKIIDNLQSQIDKQERNFKRFYKREYHFMENMVLDHVKEIRQIKATIFKIPLDLYE